MTKKKPSERERNDLRIYLNDDDYEHFLKRMRESGFTSYSAYARSLIIKDFVKSK